MPQGVIDFLDYAPGIFGSLRQQYGVDVKSYLHSLWLASVLRDAGPPRAQPVPLPA
jgi:hypothetical protein